MSYILKKDALVPCTNQTPHSQCLADRHSFFLTTGYTTNSNITNDRILHMFQAEDCHKYVDEIRNKFITRLISERLVGSTRRGRKSECLLYSECWEVNCKNC